MLTMLYIAVGYVLGFLTLFLVRNKHWLFKKVQYVEIEELTNIHNKISFLYGKDTTFGYTSFRLFDNKKIKVHRSMFKEVDKLFDSLEEANEELDKMCLERQKELENQLEQGQHLLT